jgi:hypothetical protein
LNEEPQFTPYQLYLAVRSQIDEFASLSEYSYGLAQQLLFKHPKDSVRLTPIRKPSLKDLSYSMADQQIEKVELSCEWVTLQEYAEREATTLEEVTAAAEADNLGPLRARKDGTKCILWPSDYHSADESHWPELGKKKYAVQLKVTAKAPYETEPSNLELFEETQREYLRLAHALGNPSKVTERARELLNRSIFLLEWITFEVFLRATIQELTRRHPKVLASGKRGKDNISLEEVIKLSNGLSDVTLLRDNLANREIERQEHGGESVHGLLNLLKSQFNFKSDPYSAWYVLNGKRKRSTYKELLELKDIRNLLVHDAGRASSEFQNSYPAIPVRNGVVVIDDQFSLRASLVLRSIAYLVAKIISSGQYSV